MADFDDGDFFDGKLPLNNPINYRYRRRKVTRRINNPNKELLVRAKAKEQLRLHQCANVWHHLKSVP